MAENSKIEWTDHTFNPWRGCAHKVLADGTPHPGCEHCYAEAMSRRNPATLGVWGESGVRVMASQSQWKLPHKWNAAAAAAGRMDRVFCASLADVFEDWPGQVSHHAAEQIKIWRGRATGELGAGVVCDEPEKFDPVGLDDLRRELFKLIDATPHLFWLLLTKRPENVREMWPMVCVPHPDGAAHSYSGRRYRPNVAIGTSISDQRSADELVPKLLACRDLTPVLFLSVEPLVGPLSFSQIVNDPPNSGFAITDGFGRVDGEGDGINWAIVGGESGPHARPMHPQWARDVRDQCTAAGVPFFFKQWGEWSSDPGMLEDGVSYSTHEWGKGFADHVRSWRVGKHAAGRLLDGREWNELPEAFTPAETAR